MTADRPPREGAPGEPPSDRLTERQRFLESIAAGLADAESGRVMDTAELRKRLQARHRERPGG